MSFKHPCKRPTCVDCIHRDEPGRHLETSVHLMPSTGIYTACGRRLRQLSDPKFGPDGKPIRKPVIGYTYIHLEIVSCPKCREAAGLGPWTGAFVPSAQIAGAQ